MEIRPLCEITSMTSFRRLPTFLIPSLSSRSHARLPVSASRVRNHAQPLGVARAFSNSSHCLAKYNPAGQASTARSGSFVESSKIQSALKKLPDSFEPQRTLDELLEGIVPPKVRRNKAEKDPLADVQDAYADFNAEEIPNRQVTRPGDFVKDMKFPSAPNQSLGHRVMDSVNMADYRAIQLPRKRTIRSRPSVGRTIEVDPGRGMDVAKALRHLTILCTANNIRTDKNAQRFHERPGMKRKRLKILRWRLLFKTGFTNTVKRVKDMRRQGW